MINPMMMIMQMMQGGMSQQAILQQIMQQNPMMRNAMPLIQGKNPNALKSTFFNMCKERGINPEQFAKQFGMNLPK